MTSKSTIYYFIVIALIAIAVPRYTFAQQSNEQMASYYYQNREFDKAIELYEPLYARTNNVFYYQMLYQSYVEIGNYKEAEKLVEKRIKKQPRDLTLLVDLGLLHKARGDNKKAEKAFESAIDKIGHDSKQVTDLAMAFEKAGMTDYAIKTYLASRKLMNNNLLYIMELATLYEKKGDYEKMMSEYFDLLDNQPRMIGSVQISLQRALNETSSERLSEGLRKTLTSRIRQNPNNQSYLEMMIWFSLQEQDFDFALTQAMAVDARFPDAGAAQVLRVAQISENNEAYDVAVKAFNHLVSKGKDHPLYIEGRLGLLRVKYSRLNKNHAISEKELTEVEQDYENALNELGKNEKTIPIMRNYAHLLAYNSTRRESQESRLQRASDILYDIIEMPRVPAKTVSEVKLELGDLLLFAGETWDASLLYSQVEKANKNDIIGAQAKYKNALLSYYNNDFQWAKSQLDVLRASTSKLIANDAMQLSLLISDNMEEDSTYDMLERYAAADLLIYRNKLDSAWVVLDDIVHRNLSHSLFDEVLMQKARIRMKQGRYNEADTLLQTIVDHYGTDILADDALFMLAELNEQQLNNPVRAKECYEKLILEYPTSLYIDRARKRYNLLKNTAIPAIP
ncbi:MAG: tetratricopeptide repeat protein [Bacteroidales bacterium]|nr:tetratricopeptide repeat protein [Bacteroidales bacterium]